MVMSDPQLQSVVQTIVKSLSLEGENFGVGLDFEAWNQRFPPLALKHLLTDLDDLFGFAGDVYKRAMTCYSSFLVLVKLMN